MNWTIKTAWGRFLEVLHRVNASCLYIIASMLLIKVVEYSDVLLITELPLSYRHLRSTIGVVIWSFQVYRKDFEHNARWRGWWYLSKYTLHPYSGNEALYTRDTFNFGLAHQDAIIAGDSSDQVEITPWN
ncbi:unnamed protein product [Albugo candida]|uniref:Uncharacterized protein n=1 Tax=Albugo candida TaxID=65357 RepID=A0A024G4W0_9STRA|nr:unnamed protein product [Albugo candida]|eukprot:CCI41717.1 unnamed protein product [Albugo candida]